MPREKIEIPHDVVRLAILDEEGQVDRELEPELSDELVTKMLRAMLFARRADERLLKLHGQGKIGTFGPIKGQEASQVGVAAAMDEKDWLVPSFREMAAELWCGRPLESVLLAYGGYNEGGASEEDVRVLPQCIPVATQLPYAVGFAWALAKEDGAAVVAYFGDGATSEGDFHEALNFGGVLDTPTLFVCQNNQYAISVPRSKQTESKTLAQKGLAYGLPCLQVDGNDPLAVYVAAKEGLERARKGEGPTLMECVTYRREVHTTADDPSKYRSEEEVERWRERDPIDRFRDYAQGRGAIEESAVESLEEEIAAEIDEAVERFSERAKKMGDPLDLFEHLYAERPPYLEKQREELARALESGSES